MVGYSIARIVGVPPGSFVYQGGCRLSSASLLTLLSDWPAPSGQVVLSTCCNCRPCPITLFDLDMQYEQIATEIEQIKGVVTHGLLLNVPDAVVVADQQAGVRMLQRQDQETAAATAAS